MDIPRDKYRTCLGEKYITIDQVTQYHGPVESDYFVLWLVMHRTSNVYPPHERADCATVKDYETWLEQLSR